MERRCVRSTLLSRAHACSAVCHSLPCTNIQYQHHVACNAPVLLLQRDDKKGRRPGEGRGGEGSSAAGGSASGAGGGFGSGDDLDYTVYGKFTALVAPRGSVRPKARPLSWLMRLIEEIYDARYAKDTADLRGEAEAGMDGAGGDAASTPFPQFVVDFFSKRYGLRSLIDQTAWDLLANVHAARREHLEVETFARFLEAYYDPDDLLFYLYVRSVVQKELGVSFRTRWSELGRAGAEGGVAGSGAPAPLFLSARECAVVARVVFSSEADPLYRTFMAMLERHMTAGGAAGSGPGAAARRARGDARRIEATQFLHLALVEYHETRPADESELAAMAASATSASSAAASAAAAAADRERAYGGSRGGSPAGAGRGTGAGGYGYGAYGPGGGGADFGEYDDMAAAGLAGSGSGDADALVRQAEAAYDGRLGSAPVSSSSATAAASAPSAAASAASTTAALLARSPTFFDDLGEEMNRANESYLVRALAGASSLPPEVQEQIRAEVKAQLESRLDAVLASTIRATQTGASTGVPARDALASHFRRVMAAAAGDAAAAASPDATVPAFCAAVLAQPEVQETVAPLVSLLVTYAASRLQEAAAGQ